MGTLINGTAMRYLSLFSGIEAAAVAWAPLQWTAIAFAEIEPFPCALLAHHYPNVPNLGDVTRITREQIAALGHIDIVVGGFPCQDVSIAGRREGLARDDGTATRSGLFFDAMRIANWTGSRWLVIENVPGLFSVNGGRDFAAVVGAMAGCEFDLPADGWRNAGVAVGPKGLVEWCVLDAQYHGLAQRRRRVFLVRDSGDWTNRPPLFLESYRLSGNPAPSRETQQDIAGTIAGGARKRGGFSHDDVEMIPSHDPACTLTAREYKGALPEADLSTVVTHSLRADGFDASEDGTGRGTPLIPICFDETQITNPDNRCNPQPGDPSHPLAAAARPPTIAFANTAGDTNLGMGIECAPPITGRHGDPGNVCQPYTLAIRGRGDSHDLEYRQDGVANALLTPNGGRAGIGVGAIATQYAVRRLTPTECEFLQGFPRSYTLIPYRGKPAADGPRYKALGNSMAVPVVRWIGRRIAAVDTILRERAA